MSLLRRFAPRFLRRYLARLRFPQLFLLAAILFAVDLAVPDVLPLVDEILLGLVSLMLGTLKRRVGGGEREEARAGDGE